ncbi:MAG: ComF family protein [bacterium]|nr:ComF family protein [bacterium]
MKAKFKEKFNQLKTTIFETFYPGFSCDGCGIELKNNSLRLCDDCLAKLIFHNGKTCRFCGTNIKEKELVCERCKSTHYNFDSAISVCDYNELSAYLIKSFKFDGNYYVGETIAKLMAKYFKVRKIKADYLTFVPLGEDRLKDRGFNQSQVLAELLSTELNIPCIDLLRKVKETPKQSLLSMKERFENLKDAFVVKEKANLKGKTIILIDDVFTTGTTLNECSLIVKKLKPEKIIAFTFAKTIKLED